MRDHAAAREACMMPSAWCILASRISVRIAGVATHDLEGARPAACRRRAAAGAATPRRSARRRAASVPGPAGGAETRR